MKNFILALLCMYSALALSWESTQNFHYDIRGNVQFSKVESAEKFVVYEPFGKVLSGSSGKSAYFQGLTYDADKEYLVPTNERYYSPTDRIFLSMDVFTPIDCSQCFNEYQYGFNNPIHKEDANGQIPLDTISDIGFIIYDIGKIGVGYFTNNPLLIQQGTADLVADSVALAIPYVPAGSSRILRAIENQGGKTYQTYTKKNIKTGQIYVGRTSGTGTPTQNVAKRESGHHLDSEEWAPAQLVDSSSNSNAIRGREQQLIDHYGGAQSDKGTSGNKIRGVSKRNLKRDIYEKAANDPENFHYFGD